MSLKQIYRLLRPLDHPVVDRAMADALPTADPAAQQLLVLSLLERRHGPALVALVQHMHDLTPQLQQVIVSNAHRLDPVLRAAATDQDVRTRLNLVDLVIRAQGFRLAYLLAAQLRHDDARLRRAAAAALLNLAYLVKHHHANAATAGFAPPEHENASSDERASAATRPAADSQVKRLRYLGSALEEAVSCFHQHGRQDVLAAAALLSPAQPRQLMRQLTDRRCPAHPALCEMIRHAERPEIQHALLTFACLAAFEPLAVECLASRFINDHLPVILPTAHLIVVPDVRAAVRKVTGADHLAPSEAALAALPAETQRLVPRWIGTVRASDEAKLPVLRAAAASDDRLTRLLTLRRLQAWEDETAYELVATMCFDEEPVIARIALRHLRRRRWSGLTRLMVKLLNSPHASVKRMAETELAQVGFRRLWAHWPQMDEGARLAAGRAVLKIDANFHKELDHRLRSGEASERLQAITIVRALELPQWHEQRLTQLLADSDRRVASSAAAALGRAGDSPEVAEQLDAALRHDDDRVRSNAIESLQRLGQAEKANAALQDLARRAGNRSRATAIQAMLKEPTSQTLPELTRMLEDSRPEHRTSALWAVQTLGLDRVARRVAVMAKQDPDSDVRRRALDLYRRLDPTEQSTADQHVAFPAQPSEGAGLEAGSPTSDEGRSPSREDGGPT